MSVDIAWDTITSGEAGRDRAEQIRAFVHDKFQQIELPRFIKAVHVHSFDFGSSCPDIEIKDICDPLPDFYEEQGESDEDEDENGGVSGDQLSSATTTNALGITAGLRNAPVTTTEAQMQQHFGSNFRLGHPGHPAYFANPGLAPELQVASGGRQIRNTGAPPSTKPFPKVGTPGIPGGTSNMGYFHMPMGSISGTQTPLAAVASGTPLSPAIWQHPHFGGPLSPALPAGSRYNEWNFADPSSRPSTADTLPSPPEIGSPFNPSSPKNQPLKFPPAEKVSDDPMNDFRESPPPLKLYPSNPSDLQVVARVQYSGDIRMTLTAEILLDYPMPSFVSIPLKLSITGMTFDGVAILAYIKKRMHFCFLDPEDAEALVADHITEEQRAAYGGKDSKKNTFAGLLKEIHVESEIGRQESGKQVLKNVGKVEKFVLEQVRRIFEEEFAFPSFWTFLV